MPSRRALASLALALLSLVGSLLALEVALRVRRGAGLFADPDPAHAVRMFGGSLPARYDDLLGYAPDPGRFEQTGWRVPVAIDARGLRENGNAPAPDGPAILAVGDSFTFGDEVDDRSTWPAALERQLGRRVWNGGVFGYGFDQIALRVDRLAEALLPDTLVVYLIPDDVSRCEYAYRFAHKPWFEVADGGELLLRNVPPPRPEQPPPGDSALRRLLARSFLADLVLRRLDPLGWPVRGSVRVHRDGEAVALRLLERLHETATRRGMRLLLVAGWHPNAADWRLDPLRKRARELGIELLDLAPVLGSEVEAHGDWSHLFNVADLPGRQAGHFTPLGNERVASAIAGRLRVPALQQNR